MNFLNITEPTFRPAEMEVYMSFSHSMDNLWDSNVQSDLQYNINKCYKNGGETVVGDLMVNVQAIIV